MLSTKGNTQVRIWRETSAAFGIGLVGARVLDRYRTNSARMATQRSVVIQKEPDSVVSEFPQPITCTPAEDMAGTDFDAHLCGKWIKVRPQPDRLV